MYGKSKNNSFVGSWFVSSSLVLGLALFIITLWLTPFVAAQKQQSNSCMQDQNCAAIVKQLQKAFAGYNKQIQQLMQSDSRFKKTYDKKKALLQTAQLQAIEQEFAAVTAGIAESKDWYYAFTADMHTAVNNYDIDELEDLLATVSDISEPIDKTTTHLKKLQPLLQ